MGADVAEAFPAARAIYDEADEALGWSIAELSFNGPIEKLNDTRFTQPALYVHSCAAGRVLRDSGVRPDYLAGHSLGEYSALAVGGAFSFADGLRLVVKRAEAMAEATEGTMAAVIGLDESRITDVLSGFPEVVAANYNAPGQTVISGTVAGVEGASRALAEAGALRVVPLSVSGAFHSRLLESAGSALASAVDATDMSAPDVPIVPNVTADPTVDADEIRRLLVQQITSPVRWTDTVRALVGLGVGQGYEVGPGKVLQGLARRIDRNFSVVGAGTADELAALRDS